MQSNENQIRLEGEVTWLRGKGQADENCFCCEGPHVFGYRFSCDGDEELPSWKSGLNMRVHDALAKVPSGGRYRITIEAIEGIEE